MLVSASISTGILRLALLWLFLFYCYKKTVNNPKDFDIINFIVSKWFKYGSVTILIIYILVLLNGYDLFNTIFILSLYILFDSFNFKSLVLIYRQLVKKVKQRILFLLKHIELNHPLIHWVKIKTTKSKRNEGVKSILLIVTVSLIIFFFRVDLFKYDKYILSELWVEDLQKVISYNFQNTFQNLAVVEGEYFLINFYSKLVNISPEVALETFGILQPICLSIIILWAIKKIGRIGYTVPIITAMIFGVVLIITPINLNYITQHQSLFSALILAIPLFVYIGKPKLITTNNHLYFIYIFIALLAIGLINIFVLLIIVFPFVIINLLQPIRLYLRPRILTFLAFILSISVILIVYNHIDEYFNLVHFLKVNLIAISSFTYTPHMLLPYETLLYYVSLTSVIGLLILTKIYVVNKKKNRLMALFLVYYLALIILSKLELIMIDYDLLYKSMSVITPLIIGINLIVFIKLALLIIKNYQTTVRLVTSGLSLLFIYGVCVISEDQIDKNTELTSQLSKDLLNIYDKIDTDFMPYTYAVVNTTDTQVLSIQKHFFITYNDFNTNYTARDSIYQLYKKDKKTLKKHPEYVLPETVLFFKYKNTDSLKYPLRTSEKSEIQLQNLQIKGRNISKIYESEQLEVLEIINTPRSSKIVDLIYKSR